METQSNHSASEAIKRNTHRFGLPGKKLGGGRGFSLIEVMVVVVIIGLLAGAVAIKVNGYVDTAKINRAKSDMATIVDAVEAYYLTNSRYPTNDEGLSNLPLKNHNDPWGRAYEYNSPGQEGAFEVISFGADGREGGEAIDADLYSWQLGDAEAEPGTSSGGG